MAMLRTLLILGRVSNLPTVWSNCLAGWLLAGARLNESFALLCLGGTCLYLGGMYLNDAFDAQFDQQHRSERPIPSGAIRVEAVWGWGFAWLGVGLASLFLFGKVTMILALLLTLSILVYDAVHKMFAFSPVLMAACRFFLVVTANSVPSDRLNGQAIWSALALASYIVGLSYLARRETGGGALSFWPCLFLAAPIVLAGIVNFGENQWRAVWLSALLLIWMVRCLRLSLWAAQRNVGRTVSGLLAGIPLVDWLSVWEGNTLVALIFAALFGLALLFQRFVPAT
ncbi:MAG TPA: UbiA family prenyltransferase [Verrucomicrobiae bacterium]|nr:UbiA family prenyltransferase [Verrucomicrobiae bacterium]